MIINFKNQYFFLFLNILEKVNQEEEQTKDNSFLNLPRTPIKLKKVIRLDSRKSCHSSRSESPPLVSEKEKDITFDETSSNAIINQDQDESFISTKKPKKPKNIKLKTETNNVNRSPLTKESYLYFMDIKQMHIRKKEENRLILRKENFIKKNKLISSNNPRNKNEEANDRREQNDKKDQNDRNEHGKIKSEELNDKIELTETDNDPTVKNSSPKKEEEIMLKNMNLKKDEETMQKLKKLKLQKKETKIFNQNNEPLTPKEIVFNKKYASYKNFIACITVTNFIKKVEKFTPPFKYFIGKGNNSSLILNIMKSK